MTIDIQLPIEDGPSWMSHIEISRADEGVLQLRIVKRSGEDYGRVIVSDDKLRKIIDLI